MPGAFETHARATCARSRRPRTSTCRAASRCCCRALRAGRGASAAVLQPAADALLRRRRPAPARSPTSCSELAIATLRRAHPVDHRPRRDRDRAVRALHRRRCLSTGDAVGVPVPGARAEGSRRSATMLEARVRGPNITPGYWRDEELTRAAFDEEGFYRMGDAIALRRSGRSVRQGFMFRRTARRGLQAVDRHVGQRRSAARAAPRARSATSPRTSSSPATIATRRRARSSRTCARAARLLPRLRCRRRRDVAATSGACGRHSSIALDALTRDEHRQLDARRARAAARRAAVDRRAARSPTRDRSIRSAVLARRAALVDALYERRRRRHRLIDLDDHGLTATPNRSIRRAADRDRRARPPRGADERQRRRRRRDEVLRRRRRGARRHGARRVLPVAQDGVRRLHGGRAAHRAAAGVERRRRRVRRARMPTSRSRSRASIRRAAPTPCARRSGWSPRA